LKVISENKVLKLKNSSLGSSILGDNPSRIHDTIYIADPPEKDKSVYKQVGDLIDRQINAKTNNNSQINNFKLCDMGCATGDFTSYLLKRFSKLEVIGIDYHVELIEQAKKNYQKFFANRLEFKEGSILESKTLPSASLDILTVLGVLSMFDEIEIPLKNCAQWLKPGGLLVIFNMFNSFDIDVFLRFTRGGKKKNLEVGWNIFSEKLVIEKASLLGFENFTFHDFNVNFKRLPHSDDPLRSWTVTVDGRKKMLNGLNILHPFKILTCTKKF
jgi:SAM-dependent methyltransferase